MATERDYYEVLSVQRLRERLPLVVFVLLLVLLVMLVGIACACATDHPMQALERFAFYAAAKKAFAIVRTGDSGPYGCFILRKGVVVLGEL